MNHALIKPMQVPIWTINHIYFFKSTKKKGEASLTLLFRWTALKVERLWLASWELGDCWSTRHWRNYEIICKCIVYYSLKLHSKIMFRYLSEPFVKFKYFGLCFCLDLNNEWVVWIMKGLFKTFDPGKQPIRYPWHK